MSAQTYQVEAHFEAINKGILMLAMKTLEKFYSFQKSSSEAQCLVSSFVQNPFLFQSSGFVAS